MSGGGGGGDSFICPKWEHAAEQGTSFRVFCLIKQGIPFYLFSGLHSLDSTLCDVVHILSQGSHLVLFLL